MGLDPADVADAVQLAHAAALHTSGGGNATYIPYLAKVPAQLSAVCAVTPTLCDPLEALDVYTRQCSTLITCFNLATMAATLANHGVNPLTGVEVVKRENVPRILAEMVMEGLYDTSGAIPAPSGRMQRCAHGYPALLTVRPTAVANDGSLSTMCTKPVIGASPTASTS